MGEEQSIPGGGGGGGGRTQPATGAGRGTLPAQVGPIPGGGFAMPGVVAAPGGEMPQPVPATGPVPSAGTGAGAGAEVTGALAFLRSQP
jgi:hypothetical protein